MQHDVGNGRRSGLSLDAAGAATPATQRSWRPLDSRIGTLWNIGQYCPAHSALMPAALTMGHHFAISAFWKAPSASGVCCSRGGTLCPKSASRWRTKVPPRASTTVLLRFAITVLGVPLGTHSPIHSDT